MLAAFAPLPELKSVWKGDTWVEGAQTTARTRCMLAWTPSLYSIGSNTVKTGPGVNSTAVVDALFLELARVSSL
jgi:hypothetical protein